MGPGPTQLQRLQQLMAQEPPLALWAVCIAGRSGDWHPRSLEDVSAWLAGCWPEVLEWSRRDTGTAQSVPRAVPLRWRELAADSVAVAHLAANQAATRPAASEAFLLGLLHNSVDWLRSCGPRASPLRPDAGCLPAWLAALLRGSPRTAPWAAVPAVAQGVALWRTADRHARRAGTVDLRSVARARRRWRAVGAADDGSACFLPRLTARLRRLDDLETRFQQVLESEKLAAMGELAYGASHEINNPLANISTRAQALLADESDPERRRMLATICAQAFRAHEMIAGLMLFARPPALDYQTTDLVQLADSVIAELRDDALAQGTHLARTSSTAPVMGEVDATQLGLAVRAVCVNALEAVVADGEVTLQVERVADAGPAAPPWVRISVADTGPGIPPDVRRHLFDPFFSGREAGRGLGVGLAKCWRILTLHGGRIEVHNHQPRGTVFHLELPAHRASADLPSPQPVPPR